MTLNPLGGLDLKNRFFKKDAVIIDTFLFRLHHQVFLVSVAEKQDFSVGVAFKIFFVCHTFFLCRLAK